MGQGNSRETTDPKNSNDLDFAKWNSRTVEEKISEQFQRIKETKQLKQIEINLNDESPLLRFLPNEVERCGFLVVGRFGTGKSTFINSLIGQPNVCETGESAYSVTTQPCHILAKHLEKQIDLFDTVGVQPDSLGTFEKIRETHRIILSDKKYAINGVIYIRTATDTRYSREEADELRVYQVDFDLRIILVLNKGNIKTRNNTIQKTLARYQEMGLIIKEEDIIFIEEEDIPLNEAKDFLIDFTSTNLGNKIEQTSQIIPEPDYSQGGRINLIERRVLLSLARQYTKRAFIAVGIAVPSSVAVGLSPIPFSDWPILFGIEVAMLAGICAAFKLKVIRGTLVFFVGVAVGALGLGVGLGKLLATILKFIPGANVAGMVIDGSISGIVTLSIGLAFIAVLRGLLISGVDLANVDLDEMKESLKEEFEQEFKKRFQKGNLQGIGSIQNDFETEVQDYDDADSNNGVALDQMNKEISTSLDKQQTIHKERKLKINEKRRKKGSISAEELCCICLENSPDVITRPCGHCCMCRISFEDHLKERVKLGNALCPICQTSITSWEFKTI